MRRIEHLINDCKFQTNEESARFPNARFNKLFNDAQDEIQRIIHTRNDDTKFFAKEDFINLQNGQESYDLPDDIYTESAVNSVGRLMSQRADGAEYYQILRNMSEKERRTGYGYFLQGNKIYISPIPRVNLSNGVRVNYTKKLPRLSARVGKIDSIALPNIVLTGFNPDVDITDYEDYFCIVNKDGEIIDLNLEIDSYDKSTGTISTSSSVTASVGSYVVLGKNATTHSVLPDACEKYMTIFVNRMVHYINSSREDMSAADIFTEREREDITLLFAKNDNDVKYPTITDDTYLNL